MSVNCLDSIVNDLFYKAVIDLPGDRGYSEIGLVDEHHKFGLLIAVGRRGYDEN
jgi:hypothetical protein